MPHDPTECEKVLQYARFVMEKNMPWAEQFQRAAAQVEHLMAEMGPAQAAVATAQEKFERVKSDLEISERSLKRQTDRAATYTDCLKQIAKGAKNAKALAQQALVDAS